jgi:2-polyprenyl-3-methyl-5-hydroxy-6-metoxy-1,4-benzoquinol methylase
VRVLEDFLRTRDGGVVLDIACGGGAFTKRLTESLQSYGSVTGLDIKAEARETFLQTVQGQDICFVAGSIHDYVRSTGNSFDTISVSNALHHLQNVGDVLKDVANLMRDSGIVIVNEMHSDDLTPAQQTQHDQHRFLADLQRASGEYHRETFSRAEILGFVTNAGLRVQHTYENPNENAPITTAAGPIVERAEAAMRKVYPEGAPDSVRAERDRLAARIKEIGSCAPPQLTLVCVAAGASRMP